MTPLRQLTAEDKNVPIAMVKYYRDTLPHNTPIFYPKEGHLMITKHMTEILQALR